MKRRTGNMFRFLAAVLSIFLLSTTDCEAAEKASNVIPPRVEEAHRKVALLKGKISVLEDLISTAEERGIDVSCQTVSLTVAQLFTEFIPNDVSLTADDFPEKRGRWLDPIWRILSREEVLKRIEQLTASESQETERVLNKAIKEVKEILQDSSRQTRIPSSEIENIHIKNGAFHDGDRPVFVSGIYGIPGFENPEKMDLAKKLGANLLGPLHIGHGSRDWDKFDDSHFKNRIFPTYQKAREKGMLVAPGIWSYRAPAWLAKAVPDIVVERGKGWFRDYIDIDHPMIEKYERGCFGHIASQLKNVPNNLCYSLMGEEMCSPGYRGKYTAARYEKWLKDRHGTIEGLNKAWGAAYKDFKAAADQESSKPRGWHHDWHTFNAYRLTALNQWQVDAIKAEDSNALTSCWPAAGGLVSTPIGGFDPKYGRNREDITRQSCITGWDGAMIPCEAGETTRHLPESQWAKYNMGWRDELIYYDFAKSICPDQPVFDPELHSITSVYHLTPLGISPDYMRASLWLQHLHGMGAHLMWYWGRNEDGSPRSGEFLGGPLTQPQLLDAWGRTVLELRRLTDYVVLFPQLERKVRILYSESSAIHSISNKKYPLKVRDLYEAVYFLDYPAGFVTERMVREGALKDCSLLIIPGAQYMNEQTVAKIREYLQNGGRVLIAGRGSLKYDEYGKERNISDFLQKDVYLTGSSAEQYSDQLDKAMDQAGIVRPVRVLDKEGNNAWGVELRVASKDGKTVAYLVNLNKHDVEIALRTKAETQEARNVITNETVQLNSVFVLKPRIPMLLEWE